MKKVIYCLMVVALLVALTAGCAPKPAEVIEIKSASFLPNGHPVTSYIPTWVERIKQACAGELV